MLLIGVEVLAVEEDAPAGAKIKPHTGPQDLEPLHLGRERARGDPQMLRQFGERRGPGLDHGSVTPFRTARPPDQSTTREWLRLLFSWQRILQSTRSWPRLA